MHCFISTKKCIAMQIPIESCNIKTTQTQKNTFIVILIQAKCNNSVSTGFILTVLCKPTQSLHHSWIKSTNNMACVAIIWYTCQSETCWYTMAVPCLNNKQHTVYTVGYTCQCNNRSTYRETLTPCISFLSEIICNSNVCASSTALILNSVLQWPSMGTWNASQTDNNLYIFSMVEKDTAERDIKRNLTNF